MTPDPHAQQIEKFMEKEPSFGISTGQISEIVANLRRDVPDYTWGKGELQNAIFENLARRHNLPFNKFGTADWDDPRVKELRREFTDFMERQNDIETIEGIEARCKMQECDWKTEAQAKVTKEDRFLEPCELTEACKIHHETSGERTKHNRFELYKDGKEVGAASISSQASTGYIKRLS